MEDIIKKYKKKQRKKNFLIVFSALFLAIWANFIFSNSDFWSNIKSSLINRNIENQNIANLSVNVEKVWLNYMVSIKNNIDLLDVKNITFSLVYDNKHVNILKNLENENEVLEIWNNNWITTYTINITWENKIKKDSEILKLLIEKNTSEHTNINIISWNFTTIDDEVYNLTTSSSNIF